MNVCRIALACVLLGATAASGQTFIPGVFVGTSKGPVELIAWAELTSSGQMRMADGSSIEDVPLVESVQRILCSMPEWRPATVWIASEDIFRNGYAERREMRLSERFLNIYTIELRVADLENPEKLGRVVRSVRPNGSEPAFAFITMVNAPARRHYMVRLR